MGRQCRGTDAGKGNMCIQTVRSVNTSVVMTADVYLCIWVMGNVHLDLAFRPCNRSRHCSCTDS